MYHRIYVIFSIKRYFRRYVAKTTMKKYNIFCFNKTKHLYELYFSMLSAFAVIENKALVVQQV